MADTIEELRARLRVDDSDLARVARSTDLFAGRFGTNMERAGAAVDALAARFPVVGARLAELAAQNAGATRALGALGIEGAAAGGVLAGAVAAGAIVAGKAVVDFALETANAASDVREQVNAVRVTFDEAAEGIEDFARRAGDDLGIAQADALQSASAFGAMFKAVGLGEEEAARLSQTLVGLAGDIASFKNLATEDALRILQSGLSGEIEPLRRNGIAFINEAIVKQKALELGLASTTGELSEQAKVLARLQLILEQTTDAQGDFARTADQLANQQRRLAAQTENLKARMGELTTPAVSGATQALSGLLGVTTDPGWDDLGDIADGLGQLLFGGGIAPDSPVGRLLASISVIEDAEDKTDVLAESRARAAEIERQWAKATGEADEAQQRAAKSALDLADATFAVGSAQDAVDDAVATLAEKQQAYNDIVNGTGEVLERLEDANRAKTDAERDHADAVERHTVAQREYSDLLATETERALDKVTRAALAYENALARLEDAQQSEREAQEALNTALEVGASPNTIARLQSDVRRAGLSRRGAEIDVRDAESGRADALRQQREGTDELADGLERLDAATRAADSSTDRLNDATRRYDEALAGIGPNSEAARKAAEELEDAQRNVETAMHTAAQRAAALAEAEAEAAGKTFDARDATAAYVTELERLQRTVEPGSPLHDALSRYLNLIRTVAEENAALTGETVAPRTATPGEHLSRTILGDVPEVRPTTGADAVTGLVTSQLPAGAVAGTTTITNNYSFGPIHGLTLDEVTAEGERRSRQKRRTR